MTAQAHGLTSHQRSGADLSAKEIHDLLRLRVDVFVVEQECPYPEVDGLDLLPSTTHLWLSDQAGPAASIRLLNGAGGLKIGRVVTRSDRRGERLAGRLMEAALQIIGPSSSSLEAQSYLVNFYSQFGFAVSGPEYIEDGIPHTPMQRAATTA